MATLTFAPRKTPDLLKRIRAVVHQRLPGIPRGRGRGRRPAPRATRKPADDRGLTTE